MSLRVTLTRHEVHEKECCSKHAWLFLQWDTLREIFAFPDSRNENWSFRASKMIHHKCIIKVWLVFQVFWIYVFALCEEQTEIEAELFNWSVWFANESFRGFCEPAQMIHQKDPSQKKNYQWKTTFVMFLTKSYGMALEGLQCCAQVICTTFDTFSIFYIWINENIEGNKNK